jgi:hypothetical protein
VLGCEVESEYSPAVQRKIVSASTRNRSYAEASADLRDLAELDISEKQCERISQRIGQERLGERAQREEDFQSLPLCQQKAGQPADAPANSWEGRVAAVIVDGGRAQLRDERWGTPKKPGEQRNWWREPKIGLVATFQSTRSDEDPLPDVPECLLDPLFVIPRVLEMKSVRGGRASEETLPALRDTPLNPPPHDPERWSPEPLVRSVVGTFGPYEELGRLAEVEAWQRGFAAAPRKVFLGDGLPANWTLHEQRFSRYTAVVDLMHAIAYVYTSALESCLDMEDCWQRYSRWIKWVWEGNVTAILEELKPLVAAAPDERRREALESCLTYLTHNASRMHYREYRKAGLPITTALGESTMKQINRRMKGTEKFWKPGAEPQLQLCCDQLSETNPLDDFWERRAARQTGFRKSRSTS